MNSFAHLRRRLCSILFVLATFAAVRPMQAQQPVRRDTVARRDTAAVRDTTTTDTTTHGVKPRTAFIRSLIVPGWGQMSVGAYTRGAVFIGLQSASWFMLVKTLNKLSTAKTRAADSLAFMRTSIADTLHAQVAASKDTAFVRRFSNADTFALFVNRTADTTHAVTATRSLVNSRQQQRQDWITYTLFLTLASGVDAFVAAHLADFPASISTRRLPSGASELRVNVPFPRRR